MSALSVFSPAKINLFLAITGRRADGFHELVSVVAQVGFGDMLVAEPRTEDGGQRTGNDFTLECDDSAVPVDGSNLVLRAAAAFAVATLQLGSGRAAGRPFDLAQGGPFGEAQGRHGGVHFRLEKRIPIGAGLGGGSSNAVAALRSLNQLAGEPLDVARLAELAAGLGSDCPLFLHNGPVVMRGRGERVEPLQAARLRGRRVLIFKPPFGISTAWAYARLAAEAPRHYLSVAEAEARLGAWLTGNAPAEELLFNSMEGVAFAKFLALPVLLDALREEFGLLARMSGSGSACFALLPADTPAAQVVAVTARIRELWGAGAFVVEAKIM